MLWPLFMQYGILDFGTLGIGYAYYYGLPLVSIGLLLGNIEMYLCLYGDWNQ